MRMVGVAAVVVFSGAACGRGAVPATTNAPAVVETAPHAPVATVASDVASPGNWNVELAATADVLRNVALAVGSQGTSVVYVEPATRRIDRVRRGTAGWWSPEHIVDAASAHVTFDLRSDAGPSWALLGDEPVPGKLLAGGPDRIWAQRLTAGSRPERVLEGAARASAIALGSDGAPHACVSTKEHPSLAYASRGKQRWSTTTIGKESERCAIAVGDDESLVVASASVADVDVAVRSRAGAWKQTALSAGEQFAALDVAVRGKDAVVAFSNGHQVKLARLRDDGTWTQTVLVADAGGLVGALALALDRGGRARVACSVRREKGSSDEVALASEVTGTCSTVASNDGWRFTSLSLVLDREDRPHIAFTGAYGRVFYATAAGSP